jgi:chromosome segregation ATPase
MADNHEPLIASRRLDSATKQARVRAAIEDMIASGDTLTVADLARRAKVSRRFIYDHPELRADAEHQAAISAARHSQAVSAQTAVTVASLRADLANIKAANQRLQKELAALRHRLGHTLGQEVLADIACDELTAVAAIAAPRLAELEHAHFETQEALTQRTEELEAARQINRELLERLNRRRPS